MLRLYYTQTVQTVHSMVQLIPNKTNQKDKLNDFLFFI